ncbi:hypothetical protein RGC35_02135 [Helicobacter pylori]|nr:hypothetical protein [Helicobacter pylori]MDU9770838.1 hypothetical protein [Helicobacter pylori]
MLKNFKKAFFRALCLGALCLLGEWCSNLGRLLKSKGAEMLKSKGLMRSCQKSC